MNKFAKQFALVLCSTSFGLGIGATSALAAHHMKGANQGYVTAPGAGNVVVKNPFGLCWRTSYWTPSMATAECDKDLMPMKARPKPKYKSLPPLAKPAMETKKPMRKPMVEKVTMAADAHFDFDKATLKPEGKAKLNNLVSKLKAVKLEVIIAIGHTDSIGSKAYNQKLSLRRANSVKYYLESMGVPANRIYTEGKGETQPVADNRTKEGRAKNRRVEIEVVGTRSR